MAAFREQLQRQMSPNRPVVATVAGVQVCNVLLCLCVALDLPYVNLLLNLKPPR